MLYQNRTLHSRAWLWLYLCPANCSIPGVADTGPCPEITPVKKPVVRPFVCLFVCYVTSTGRKYCPIWTNQVWLESSPHGEVPFSYKTFFLLLRFLLKWSLKVLERGPHYVKLFCLRTDLHEIFRVDSPSPAREFNTSVSLANSVLNSQNSAKTDKILEIAHPLNMNSMVTINFRGK